MNMTEQEPRRENQSRKRVDPTSPIVDRLVRHRNILPEGVLQPDRFFPVYTHVCSGSPRILLNGELLSPEIKDGYIMISRIWSDDNLDVFFPSEVRFEPLEDAPELVAMVDGPIVLAGLTDRDCGLSGSISGPARILLPETPHTYDTYVWLQNTYRTRFQPENFRIVPLYEVTDESYTVYFTSRS